MSTGVIKAEVPGAPVYVAPSGDAPLVWFEVAIRGGAAADPVGLEGLHRHAALLARRGAGGRDRTAFDDDLDRLGAALDVSIARDSTTVSALSLTRNLDAVVDLCVDLLAAPRFADDELSRLLRDAIASADEFFVAVMPELPRKVAYSHLLTLTDRAAKEGEARFKEFTEAMAAVRHRM